MNGTYQQFREMPIVWKNYDVPARFLAVLQSSFLSDESVVIKVDFVSIDLKGFSA